MKKELIRKIPELFIKHIRYLNNIKYNYTQVVTGLPGSGKTMQALMLAWMIKPHKFNEECYTTSAKEFLDWINDPKRKTGDCIVWDEPGIGLKARHWWSLSNILVGETLQVYRLKRLNVFFSVSDFSFIDIQARKLITAFSECQRTSDKEVKLYLYHLRIDRKRGTIQFPYYMFRLYDRYIALRRIIFTDKVYKIFIEKNKEVMKNIIEKMIEFKEKTMKIDQQQVSEIEKIRMGRTLTIFDLTNLVSENMQECINKRGRLDRHLVKVFLDKTTGMNVSSDTAKTIVKLLERKQNI